MKSETTSTPDTRHLLLICPAVFSYYLVITKAAEALGYRVTWWNERASNHVLYKLALRVFPHTGARLSCQVFHRLAAGLRGQVVDDVLVIKGEGVAPGAVRDLRREMPDANFAMYQWDSVRNVPVAVQTAPLFDRVSTFDPRDANTFGWQERPLFSRDADATEPARATAVPRYDWSFIGTLHADRHRVLNRLRRSAPQRPAFVFCFAPGRVMMMMRLLSDPSLWRAPPGTMHMRPLGREAVAEVVASSRAIVDIEHPGQRGLTMRSIEALLAGRKLVTTNPHILQSDLFDASRVHVMSRESPSIPDAFLSSPITPIADTIRARYTTRRWLQDVLGVAGGTRQQ